MLRLPREHSAIADDFRPLGPPIRRAQPAALKPAEPAPAFDPRWMPSDTPLRPVFIGVDLAAAGGDFSNVEPGKVWQGSKCIGKSQSAWGAGIAFHHIVDVRNEYWRRMLGRIEGVNFGAQRDSMLLAMPLPLPHEHPSRDFLPLGPAKKPEPKPAERKDPPPKIPFPF